MSRWIELQNTLVDIENFMAFGIRRSDQQMAVVGWPKGDATKMLYLTTPSSQEEAGRLLGVLSNVLVDVDSA